MLDGDPAPTKGAQPQFSAHVRCGQTPGWIKMPHGMEVGLGPGEFVSGGDPAPPHFRPMSIVAKRSPISDSAMLFLG